MEIALSLEEHPDIPSIAEHQAVELVCAAPWGAQLSLTIAGQLLEPFLRPDEAIWRWRWNPGAAVGVHHATLAARWHDGRVQERTWVLRVVTRKLDQERYEALLEDIQRVAYSILYTLAGMSAEGAGLQREVLWQRSPLEEYYALFADRLDTFERAVRRIAARPHEHLRDMETRTLLGQAAAIDADALAQLPRGELDAAPPGVADELQAALRPGGGLLPREVPVQHAAPTTDIYEHRLLKHLLFSLLRRARFIHMLADREVLRLAVTEEATGVLSTRRSRAEQISAGCRDATRRLRDLSTMAFLADVRPLTAFRGATALLRRDAAYREVYRMWLALRQHPFVAFDSPLFHLPIADLPHLYEIWCVLQVVQALLACGGTVREQRLLEGLDRENTKEDLEFAIDLVEDAPLLVIDHGECTLTLRYQPHYRPLGTQTSQWSRFAGRRSPEKLGSLDRHTHIPDIAIEVQRLGAPPRVLLLDAKYRLDSVGRSVPQDALADAYTYLGAIGCAGSPATLGALLLYPGHGTPELYPSRVGTLPLLPGCPVELEAVLAERLDLRR
jgi:hypothetical protein